jgi:hypothetical protein
MDWLDSKSSGTARAPQLDDARAMVKDLIRVGS